MPVKPTRPVRPTRPTRPIRPVKPVKPIKPIRPTRPVKPVKTQSEVIETLRRIESALLGAASDVERSRASVNELVGERPGVTVAELASRFHLSEDAVVAFAQTAGELLGEDRSLSVEAARRGALLAAAGQAWEGELGPLLSTADVRGLLGVSRQRVDELLRSRRLIALPDSAGHRRYPAFQFHDGQPLPALVSAFWTVADAAASPWSAASWCTAPDDDALDGRSPAEWAHAGRDAADLDLVARRDAARLAQ